MTQVPQELFPAIILAAVDQKIEDALALRLVNKAWNREVLHAVAFHELLNRPSTCHRTVPWHQCIDIWAVEDSIVDFTTSYLLENPPRPSDGWKTNLPAFLATVLDIVMRDAGIPLDQVESRRRFMRTLIKMLVSGSSTTASWRERTLHQNEKMPFTLAWMLYPLPPHQTWGYDEVTNGSLDDHVAIVKFLLGTTDRPPTLSIRASDRTIQPRFSILDISAFEAAVKMGRVDIVGTFFAEHPLAARFNEKSRLFSSAVETGNIDMVKLITNELYRREPPTWVYPHGNWDPEDFECALVEAIHIQKLDIFWYLIGLRGLVVSRVADMGVLRHCGIREACYHGDMVILRLLVDQPIPEGQEWNDLDCCVTPLEIACRTGHLEMVRFLLSRGADPRGKGNRNRVPNSSCWHFVKKPLRWLPAHKCDYRRICRTAGAMFGAAVQGHTEIADVLLQTGVELEPVEWEKVALGAIELKQTEFVRWMLQRDVFPAWNGTAKYDPLAYACVWGAPETVRLLAASGFPVVRDGPFLVEEHEHESLMMAALNWSRPDMVQTLLELGVKVADPLQSRFRRSWVEGYLPRKPKVKPYVKTPGMYLVYSDG